MIAKMRNAGEACTAANRFYVEASVARGVREAAGRADGRADGRARASIRRPRSARWSTPTTVDKVDRLVQRRDGRGGLASSSAGAGRSGPGSSTQPTVLVDVPPDSPILGDEIFGPVAPIVTFESEDEAVRAGQRHRVRAGVLRLHRRPGPRVAGRRGAWSPAWSGSTGASSRDPAAPFGGVKQSGIGREGGHEGMLDYTEIEVHRAAVVNAFPARACANSLISTACRPQTLHARR